MASRFNKSLLLVLSFSSLLLSTNAIPSTRILQLSPIGSPTEAPTEVPMITNSGVNFLTSLFDSAAQAAKQINPDILKFCVGTENPALCADTISSFLHGPFDPIKALEIEVDETFKQAKNVAGIIEKKLKDPTTDKKALDALDICKSQYDDMLDTLKEAVELVSQQNVVDAYYKFSSVISYQTACGDAFTESPGVEMPFSDESLNVFQLGGNCLAMMDAIVNNLKV